MIEEVEITEQQLYEAMEYSHYIIETIIENRDEVDPSAVMFNLYMEGILALKEFGWTRNELITQVNDAYGVSLH